MDAGADQLSKQCPRDGVTRRAHDAASRLIGHRDIWKPIKSLCSHSRAETMLKSTRKSSGAVPWHLAHDFHRTSRAQTCRSAFVASFNFVCSLILSMASSPEFYYFSQLTLHG